MTQKNKKICYVLPSYDVADHTHFAYLPDLVSELGKRADIFLLIGKADGLVSSASLKEKFPVSAIKVINSGSPALVFFRNFASLLRIRLAGWQDFYVHYSFLSAFNAALITKVLGGQVFYWNCGLPWQYQRSFWRDWFERRVYKLVTHLVTGTPVLAAAYSRHYGLNESNIKVLPNWISLDKFAKPFQAEIDALKLSFGLLNSDKVLLFLHRLSRRKGAHLLPQIFRGLQVARADNFKLLIIGDGPEKQFLLTEFSGEIAAGQVKMLGWVSNSEVPKYYALADVFLLPSEEEGFPRVILEAMAAGLPFAAFDVGGIKEIIPPQFFQNIAQPSDVGQFVKIIEKILNADPQKIKDYQEIALAWVQKYQTSLVAEKFLAMFD